MVQGEPFVLNLLRPITTEIHRVRWTSRS